MHRRSLRCCRQSGRRSHVIRTRNWSDRYRRSRRPLSQWGLRNRKRSISDRAGCNGGPGDPVGGGLHTPAMEAQAVAEVSPAATSILQGRLGPTGLQRRSGWQGPRSRSRGVQGAQGVPTRRDQRTTSIHVRARCTRRRATPYHEVRFRNRAPAHRCVVRPNPACRASETTTSHELRPAPRTPPDSTLGPGALESSIKCAERCRPRIPAYLEVFLQPARHPRPCRSWPGPGAT